MKTNLKNFPKLASPTDHNGIICEPIRLWKESFENELREQRRKLEYYQTQIKGAVFIDKPVQLAQFKGEIKQITEVLGE